MTVGKWRGRFVAVPPGRVDRRAAPGSAAHDHRRPGGGCRGRHVGIHAGERDALVAGEDGRTQRVVEIHDRADLAGVRAQAAPRRRRSSSRPTRCSWTRSTTSSGSTSTRPKPRSCSSVDEKSQVQALARSQPAFPMMPGMPEKRTHDYVRHGTTSLFAALNVADGTVISSLHRRHRTVEFTQPSSTRSTAEVPADLDVHVICDNYGTHKTPTITRLARAAHPRFHLHFTPTYSSWINQVERFFGFVTDRPAAAQRSPQRPVPSRPTSAPGSRTGTPTPGPSSGPRPPKRSSSHSHDFFNELTARDTSGGTRRHE